MGYLDKTSITVDAILTKKGRELLAKNDGSFEITQFALGDSEIDYTLFNENHPNGTQYSAEAIENMPLIEAIPDGANMMQSKLITLARGTSAIPYIQVGNQTGIELAQGAVQAIKPRTFNINGNNQAGTESQGYRFTIIDNRLREYIQATGASTRSQRRKASPYGSNDTTNNQTANVTTINTISNVATAETVVGRTLTIQATTNNALFSTELPSLTTSLIIEGINTGARITVPFTVNSTTT
tara:strand:+ start:16211 stop:16933 length:723 start_codon:yes stop_codon:yes gene_type:complete